MNYDIRKISDYFREIHSRYYIDTNGSIYTSMNDKVNKIMINGVRFNINNFRKKMYENFNETTKILIPIPNTNNKYFLKNDGKILHRLSTRIDDNEVITVCLMKVFNGNKSGNRYAVSRLVAGCFIGDITNKEVHHIDGNRKNNKVNNLKILTFEEHRGKNNFLKNHKIRCVETIPKGSTFTIDT